MHWAYLMGIWREVLIKHVVISQYSLPWVHQNIKTSKSLMVGQSAGRSVDRSVSRSVGLLLPSFCPDLLYSAQLSSCPVPALLLPCSCFSPALALLQPCSCPDPGPAHPSLAAFIIISTFSAAFYGRVKVAHS